MKWQTALEFARNQSDLSYEEWCGLYVPADPDRKQILDALLAAQPILVRNKIIEASVILNP